MRVTVLAALLAGASFAPANAGQKPRPNFVVVLVDDLRFDGVAATGHPFVDTPTIDRLAREGAIFRNAFVTTPLCSPARASFLSGRYAHSHGVIDNGSEQSFDRLTTFPELLENTGYQTAFIGKWHMGFDDSPRAGFTRWISFSGQGDYLDQELNIGGRRVETAGYLTDVLSRFAAQFVRAAASDGRPFLLYLSHKAVHEPFTPPARHANLYREEVVTCSPGCRDPLVGKLALTRFVPDTEPPEPGRSGPSERQIRDQSGLVVSVDQGLGDVVEALTSAGVLDTTFIVFTSDNGYFHGEHGLGDKRWAYEESIRIPLIVRYPPLVAGGSVNDEFVLNIDLAPTILSVAGLTPPSEIDGQSLVPLLTGTEGRWRTSFVAEYFEEAPFPRIPTWEAIRTEQLKLIRYPQLGRAYDELYDLAADPYELDNRIAIPDYSNRIEQLHELLDSQLTTIPEKSQH